MVNSKIKGGGTHRVGEAHSGRANNHIAIWGRSGHGRDHKLFRHTMFASLLGVNGGSSISEAEAAGIASSGGRNPRRSIRLEAKQTVTHGSNVTRDESVGIGYSPWRHRAA